MSPTMSKASLILTSGCVVQCRSHRWLVEEVKPAEHPEADTVVRLSLFIADDVGLAAARG